MICWIVVVASIILGIEKNHNQYRGRLGDENIWCVLSNKAVGQYDACRAFYYYLVLPVSLKYSYLWLRLSPSVLSCRQPVRHAQGLRGKWPAYGRAHGWLSSRGSPFHIFTPFYHYTVLLRCWNAGSYSVSRHERQGYLKAKKKWVQKIRYLCAQNSLVDWTRRAIFLCLLAISIFFTWLIFNKHWVSQRL